jgi:hypothetical protein
LSEANRSAGSTDAGESTYSKKTFYKVLYSVGAIAQVSFCTLGEVLICLCKKNKAHPSNRGYPPALGSPVGNVAIVISIASAYE